MASATKIYKVRKRLKDKKQGRKRKNTLARHGTTPNKDEFFAGKTRTSV